MKFLGTILLSALVLGGCASFPDDYETQPAVVTDPAQLVEDNWNNVPAVTLRHSQQGLVLKRFYPIPEKLAGRKLEISVEPGETLSLDDVLYALRMQGFRIAARLADDVRARPWLSNSFSGTFGQFIEQTSALENVAFDHRAGTVVLSASNQYSVSLTQYKEYMDAVAKMLGELGAEDVKGDVTSGMLYFSARPDVADHLQEHIARLARNSAMIRLQVAIITVGLNRNKAIGLDWSTLALQGGLHDMAPGVTGGNGTGLGNLTPTTGLPGAAPGAGAGAAAAGASPGAAAGAGGVVGAAADAAKVALGQMAGFAGGEGFIYRFRNNKFSLTAALKALSTYGTARTEQNVILGTLSGLPVEIESGNDIPYVKSIGASTTSGGATTGSAQTATISSGLKVKVIPNFDAVGGDLVTDVTVDLSTLVGFRDLPAGLNLGTLSQPEMQKLKFKNVGRIQAGETVIMGGITYDQVSDNYATLPGMENAPVGSETKKVSRNAMYIILRPTVVLSDVPKSAAEGTPEVAPAAPPEALVKIAPVPPLGAQEEGK